MKIKPVILFLSAVFATALSSQSAIADQLADIKGKGVLVCGTLGTAEPFSFPNTQTREIQGYDVDFCKALADSLNVKLELKMIAVAARIPELQQGYIDVIAANLGWTEERAKQITYSQAYYVSNQVVAANKSSNITKLTDLAGKKVSAPKGSTSELGVRQAIPSAQTVTFQDPPAAFLALQQGKVQGFAVSELMMKKFQQQVADSNPIVILTPPLLVESWGIGMRTGETNLINHVNGVLTQMEKDGRASAIFDTWLGKNSAYHIERSFTIKPIE